MASCCRGDYKFILEELVVDIHFFYKVDHVVVYSRLLFDAGMHCSCSCISM